MSSLEDLEHLKIPLNDIKQATNNFAYENIIDKGAFGVVYKGELSEQILAFKRLTNVVGLQKSDFYDEVMFRSTIKHYNIISLVGFCDEDDELILVLEHGTKGSLDMYLSSPRLAWWDRVGICFHIARGLEYLQDDPRKIVLGDLKSGSIQLSEDWLWTAKIGLSKSFMMNVQPSSFNKFSNLGYVYVDPLYMETGRVTKETDIYSYGMILFEVLCGRQATTKDEDNGWFLSRLACHHYENGTLTEIIDPILRLHMDQDSLNVLSALAYQCLNMDPSIRPTAPMVVEELDKAIRFHFIGRIQPVIPCCESDSFAPTDSLCGEIDCLAWYSLLSEILQRVFMNKQDTTCGDFEPVPPTNSLCGETMVSRKDKRARKDKRVRTRNDNDSQQVEDVLQMESNHSDGDEVQVIQRKRVRGPTFMPKVWTKSGDDRISVSFNEYGQPIDKKTTSTLTHFMGSLARSGKYCPLHKPWPKVQSDKKMILLDVLNDKFDLPMGCDDWLLKSFGKKVRNWRARVKKDCYDPSLSYREQINFKPKRVHPGQWKKLVKTWNKENSKESLGRREPTRRELFRACFSTDGVAKNVEATTAIDEMEELSSQLPEGATDEPGPQDVYSKVMGKDNNGPADLYGLGVRASDVWGVVPSHSARQRDKLMYKSRCDQLSRELAELKVRDSHRQGSSENGSFGVNVVNEPLPLRVGAEVYLKSIFNSTEIVAKGRIKSLDPNEIVGVKR